MKPERLGRLATSCIIAVLAGVELQASCHNPLIAIRWWLVFAITAGIFLNTRAGENIRYLAIASVAPAIVPLIVLAFPVIVLGKDACFSGAVFSELSLGARFGVVAFFLIVSWTGIFLFSFARDALLAALKVLANNQTPKTLYRVEASIRAACTVVGAGALLYASLH